MGGSGRFYLLIHYRCFIEFFLLYKFENIYSKILSISRFKNIRCFASKHLGVPLLFYNFFCSNVNLFFCYFLRTNQTLRYLDLVFMTLRNRSVVTFLIVLTRKDRIFFEREKPSVVLVTEHLINVKDDQSHHQGYI